MSARPRLKVVYIAGWVRTGSTLLGKILGEQEGFFGVGELGYVWDRGFLRDNRCACGATFATCPLWQGAVTRAFGSGRPDAVRLLATADHLRPASRTVGIRGSEAPELAWYRDACEAIYHGVADESGARVLVDTTKHPSHIAVLDGIASLDVRVVHLVRDPRAIVWSQRRRGQGPGPLRSGLVWDVWHVMTELGWRRSGRYVRIRYEDFARDPRATVRRVLEAVGEPGEPAAFVGEHEVDLPPNHFFSGNDNRFQTGRISVVPDDEWRDGLRPLTRIGVGLATAPLLARYGYLGRGRTISASAASVSRIMRSLAKRVTTRSREA
ncbi:MAG: hypothetical protein QOE36_3442 [Gaiellaceae bacterium]|jgi:hypothetical protein|nr:hypothetical protein [Gaiellaceae bacterium]